MNILSITAGAAGMYCGSCSRDNAQAVELLARGHKVTLLPLYTPTNPDEHNVSEKRVLFGGISIYLQQYSSIFRKTPRFLDRLWDAPWVINAFASRSLSTDPSLLGDLTISMLEGTHGVLRKEFDKLLEWIADEPVPDIINLPNSMLISLAAPLRRALKRPICCTLQGEDLFLDGLVEPYRSRAIELIRAQVKDVDHFLSVSDYYVPIMSKMLAIPKEKVSVVPLGINLTGYEARPTSGDTPAHRSLGEGGYRVGYFARIAPEKGLHELAEAYTHLRARTPGVKMRLEAAGYLAGAQASYLDGIKKGLAKAGLADEFTYHGAVSRDGKLAFLQTLDVLSVPAPYDEPKGVFLLEAMGVGVPVAQPRRGAFTEIVEKTGGGVLVPPDDPKALADALHSLWQDPARRAELGRRGFDGVREQYSIQRSTDRLLAVYETVTGSFRLQAESEGYGVLQVTELSKEYPTPRGALRVLSGVTFDMAPGDAAAIMGPSGSGKSSLLYILGGLEPPSTGAVTLDGRNPYQLKPVELAAFRNKEIGFVFQDHCLLPQCTVLENVLIPTLVAPAGEDLSRRSRGAAEADEERARQLIEQVGLADRIGHRPAELSGGERQRVAIARALVRGPRLLLCDEPTGNLDRAAADNVASVLLDLHRAKNTILVVVTHSLQLAEKLPTRFDLLDAKLQRQ